MISLNNVVAEEYTFDDTGGAHRIAMRYDIGPYPDYYWI